MEKVLAKIYPNGNVKLMDGLQIIEVNDGSLKVGYKGVSTFEIIEDPTINSIVKITQDGKFKIKGEIIE